MNLIALQHRAIYLEAAPRPPRDLDDITGSLEGSGRLCGETGRSDAGGPPEQAPRLAESPSRLRRAHVPPRHHDGDLGAARCFAEKARRPRRADAAEVAHETDGPGQELRRARLQIHHAIAVDLAEPREGGGGQRIEGQLGRGPRLETGRAREDLGSHAERDDDAGGAPRDAGIARDQHGERAAPPGFGEAGAHEGRDAAGRDADHGVPGPRAGSHGTRAGARVVLGPLHRSEDSPPASRHHRLDLGGACIKGRGALRGFEHAEAAARPRPQEDELAAGPEPLGYLRDGLADGRRRATDRAHRILVHAVHQPGDGGDTQPVEPRAPGIAALRGQAAVANPRHGLEPYPTIGAMTAVLSGLDVLLGRLRTLLGGQSVGLLCHPASVTADLTPAAEALMRVKGVKLRRLFAPEHGITGAAQDLVLVGHEKDPLTGLPVMSLYGRRLDPDPRALEGLDALIVDLQDVGARYYTYNWTMALAMKAAARANLPVIVLDRPNPLGGERLEGNWPEAGWSSFVGLYPLPIRHGMTMGELAGYLNDRHELGCDLTVVPMLGWRRGMAWEDTGLPWVAPSPNMPTPDTARVYPGGCLVEGTDLSEGRGTTRPFEWIGAPYLDGARLERALTRRRLPGARFRAIGFEPAFHKWRGERCGGVQVHVTDPDRFKPVATYLALIAEARRQSPRRFGWRQPPYEFERRKLPIDLLGGGPGIRRAIERGVSLARLETSWRPDLARFARARRPYLLYS